MIPQTVPLLGHTIRVFVHEAGMWPHGDDCNGLWLPDENEIHVRGELEESVRYHTYLHELFHAMLQMMNHKLAHNENFVDSLAGLLHQALTGAVYAKPKRQKKAVSK